MAVVAATQNNVDCWYISVGVTLIAHIVVDEFGVFDADSEVIFSYYAYVVHIYSTHETIPNPPQQGNLG